MHDESFRAKETGDNCVPWGSVDPKRQAGK
jgi:hypothetical protein